MSPLTTDDLDAVDAADVDWHATARNLSAAHEALRAAVRAEIDRPFDINASPHQTGERLRAALDADPFPMSRPPYGTPAAIALNDYATDVRAEIARHGDDLVSAAGIVIGAASMCWSNPAGAGEFESERASALIGVLATFMADYTTQHRRAAADGPFAAPGEPRAFADGTD